MEISKDSVLFYIFIQNALSYHGDRGLFSSLVDWISGNATPSFIEGQSLSAEVCIFKTSVSIR